MVRKLAIAAAVAGVGVAVVSGTAFTASNSLPAASVVRGYGSQSISGVTATAVTYVLNTPEDTITGVNLTLTGDTTAKTIQIAFNDAAPATCSGTGSYDGTTSTTYSCAVSQTVSSAVKFALVAE